MSDNRTKDIVPEMAEGRHGRLRNALLENLQKLRVGELADVRARDNVGSTLPAFSVQAMAAGAGRRKGLPGSGRIRVGSLLRSRPLPVLTENNRAADKQHREHQRKGFGKNAWFPNDQSTFEKTLIRHFCLIKTVAEPHPGKEWNLISIHQECGQVSIQFFISPAETERPKLFFQTI